MLLPYTGYAITEGREENFHNKLGNRARKRAHRALKHRPAKSVPKYRRKERKHDDRENEVIEKLTDKGGNIRARGIGKLAVGIFGKALADNVIKRVIQYSGKQKRNRTAKQDKPSTAEYSVKCGKITRV